jgi:tetratricopeptide (TPR) repeat protein
MFITYLIVIIFFILVCVFGLYIFSTYVFPRKIEEIAKMIEAGQTKLAIKKLTELLAKDDRNSYAHYLLAEAYLKENNIQFAIVEFRQVLKISKFDEKVSEVEVRTKLAKIFKERNSLEDAKKEYLMLTKIDSGNYEHFYQLGTIYFDAGVIDKAAGYLRRCIELNNKHDQAFYYLGQIFYRNNSFTDAKQMLLEAIKIDQANFRAHYFLGLVLRQVGDYEWAIKEFDIAQKNEDIKTKCFLAKGTCYLERELYPKAIMEFERGLKYAKRGSDTELNMRYFLGIAQENTRDLQSAISNWEQIAAVNKNFRDVQEKLKSYSEFRQDDNIKDFMIAGLAQFEHTCRKLSEALGLLVTDIEIINDTEIEIVGADADAKWRNARSSNRLLRIMRTTESISDNLLRKLHESMKNRQVTRIVIISTGDFSQAAMDFANTRPIELIGKNELVKLLKSISL